MSSIRTESTTKFTRDRFVLDFEHSPRARTVYTRCLARPTIRQLLRQWQPLCSRKCAITNDTFQGMHFPQQSILFQIFGVSQFRRHKCILQWNRCFHLLTRYRLAMRSLYSRGIRIIRISKDGETVIRTSLDIVGYVNIKCGKKLTVLLFNPYYFTLKFLLFAYYLISYCNRFYMIRQSI